jgi:hypothetical protein
VVNWAEWADRGKDYLLHELGLLDRGHLQTIVKMSDAIFPLDAPPNVQVLEIPDLFSSVLPDLATHP